MESPGSRLCADAVFGSHNADPYRDFAQRFTELACADRDQPPLWTGASKMRYATELPFRLMHGPARS
jgi:hypothetical protein